VYVEAGGVKITCDEQQTEDLLHALCRFADDVAEVTGASEGAQLLNLTPAIVAGYRGGRW
jgi:hypothetical protein